MDVIGVLAQEPVVHVAFLLVVVVGMVLPVVRGGGCPCLDGKRNRLNSFKSA